jgi:hypothetical protein
MSANAIPHYSVIRARTTVRHATPRTLTWAAHLIVLTYVLWLPVMHALALVIYDLFGVEPGTGQYLTSVGLLGWTANLAFMVVLALPLWLGAGLAVAALRRGADGPPLAALMLNLGLAVTLVVFGVLVPF